MDIDDRDNFDKIKINEKCEFEQVKYSLKYMCCMKRSVAEEEKRIVHNIAKRMVDSMLDIKNILLKQDQFETIKLFHLNPFQNNLFNNAHLVIDLDYALTDFNSINEDFIYNYYYYNVDYAKKYGNTLKNYYDQKLSDESITKKDLFIINRLVGNIKENKKIHL